MQSNSDFSHGQKSLITTNRGKRRTKYKIITFIICLVISFVLWYLVGYPQK